MEHGKGTIYSGDTIIYIEPESKYGHPVLIKMPVDENPSPTDIHALNNEYDITHALRIRGIRKVLKKVSIKGKPALNLSYIDGTPLTELIKQENIEIKDKLDIAVRIARTLEKLHLNNVIHNDLSSCNILVHNSTKAVEIIDFGSAFLTGDMKKHGEHIKYKHGSLSYLSPEQTCKLERPVDFRSDLYSLGVILYELFTGKLPFTTGDPQELIHRHIAEKPVPLVKTELDFPRTLNTIILKLLEKNPEERYQTAAGVRADLNRCLNQLLKNGRIGTFQIARRDHSGTLKITERLFGREKELQEIMEVLNSVSKGNAEMLIVLGYAGVGKTSLIQELRRTITERGGLLLEGKYEQYLGNIPYSAFARAFHQYIVWVLSKPEAEFEFWRESLSGALSDMTKVLIDVVPGISLIMGELKDVPHLRGQEARNRFNYVIRNFINVVASNASPLVIFLDDLQWADAASLDLLRTLGLNTYQRGVFIIGAFRDNEVAAAHPLSLFLNQILKEGAHLHQLKLENIRKENLRHLIDETLEACPDIDELSSLLYEKTHGNPFFAKRLLYALYRDGHLVYNRVNRRWEFDKAEARALQITDNVVDLIITRIQSIGQDARNVLGTASCIGSRFSSSMLSALLKMPETSIIRSLETAVSLQLVQREKEAYSFTHDRVQQAAYALLNDTQKRETHLQVGRSLSRTVPRGELPEHLFVTVDHLNAGSALVTDQTERNEMAGLNLAAARRARESTAYNSMRMYVAHGLALLHADSWNTAYDLTLHLHLCAMEAEYLNADYDRTEAHASVVLKMAKTPTNKISVYELLMMSYFAQYRCMDVLDVGMKALRILGVSLSDSPPADATVQVLSELPCISEPKKLSVMKILVQMFPSAMIMSEQILPKIVYTMVKQCILHGNTLYSPMAYALYGMFLCRATDGIEQGYRFGKLALTLLERHGWKEMKPRVLEIVKGFICAWKEQLRIVVEYLRELINTSLETGDLEVACNSAMSICILLFFIGVPIDSAREEQTRNIQLINKLKQSFQLKVASAWCQLVFNVSGDAGDPTKLTGTYFDEDAAFSHLENEPGFTAFYLYLPKTILNYLSGDYKGALVTADKCDANMSHLYGFTTITVHVFYYSLILLKLYPSADREKKIEYLDKINLYNQKMKEWARHAPANFQNKYDLMEAEKENILGHFYEAIHLYDKAIVRARESGFIGEEALGCERAAELCFERGLKYVAEFYIRNAYSLYDRWGAKIKLRDLEKRYPDQFRTGVYSRKGSVFSDIPLRTTQGLNLESLIKTSQTLSSQTDLHELLDAMMGIVMQNAGADRAALLLKQGEKWFIQARGDFKTKQYHVLLNQQYIPGTTDEQTASLPSTILHLCMRSKETLAVENPHLDSRFSDDGYFKKNTIRSLLCIPLLHHAELKGILYLENSLTSHVFSDSNVETLKLLSTQFSISLENVLLYESLNERLRFEKLLSELTVSFVNIAAHDIDKGITFWLGKIVDFLGVEWGAIYSYKEDDDIFGITHSYASPGTPQPPEILHCAQSTFQTLRSGLMIASGHKKMHRETADRQSGAHTEIGLKSYLAIPMSAGGSLLGVIEFASYKKECKWSEELSQRLQILEEIFFNALERKRYEEKLNMRTSELQETAEKLKNLSVHLQDVREEERSRIAREIHDELGQTLTVLRMDTSWVGKHLNADSTLLRNKIDTMVALIDNTVKTVQRISSELRPEMLDVLGLVDAIEWFAEDFEKRVGIPCRVGCTGGAVKNKKHATVLFRILQEALTNISRHSGASKVEIRLRVDEQYTSLEIIDNGRGIRKEEIQGIKSLGIIGMRERVAFLEGTFEVSKNRGGGTKVRVILPSSGNRDD